VPALLSSLIEAPAGHLARALAPDDHGSRACLREWLAGVPGPRPAMGRWHRLEYVLALAACAFTAAGHDSPSAVAEWAAGCCQATLAVLGGRRGLWTRRVRLPGARTFARVFAGIDAGAFNAALHGWLGAVPARSAGALPPVTRHEREQRRAAAAAARPGSPGLLEQAAADGKTVRGAVRAGGSQVHLLSVLDVRTGCVRAQREVGAKTNGIPGLAPAVAHLDLAGAVVTLGALHTQVETARYLVQDKHARCLMIVKGNQPGLLEDVAAALAGPDGDFAETAWTEEGTGDGRRERRSIRTAPAGGIAWPHAAQVFRIRRGSGPTPGTWTRKEAAFGITSLPPGLAGPRHLGTYTRRHWSTENREHYVRDKTSGEDLQHVRAGNQPSTHAAIRNLVIGAFRRAGYASIAHARRWHARSEQRIPALCGYT
jgi:predicted transposase YbfD/YdcC